MKILVIEDNIEVRENIEELLQLSDYDVITAENGKQGISKAKEELPDLILCDIMMPEMDGYAVLQLLSRNPKTNKIPFIYLTAKSENEDFRKGMNLGADDYITKPFEEIELINAIETRLKRTRELDELTGSAKTLDVLVEHTDLEKILSEKKTKKYKKGEIIFREGDYPNYFYFIKEGKVKLSRINVDGKELILALVNSGEYLGYKAILSSRNYIDTATTLEDSEIVSLPRKDFEEIMHSNPEISARFIQLLSKDVEEKEQELIDLAYNSVRKRVVDNLLKLQDKFKDSSDKNFSMAFSRSDLASMTGTAKESVTRYLSELKSEGLIALKGSKITILDEEALRKIMY